jgi:hypothetical protein
MPISELNYIEDIVCLSIYIETLHVHMGLNKSKINAQKFPALRSVSLLPNPVKSLKVGGSF